MQEFAPKGKVILAGAGPGDPELLTLKTLRYLKQADVVLADRLVGPAIIRDFVGAATKLIPVGKQCRSGASTPQQTINDLMVRYALQGKLVVRLKGGDVSLFSNILDELACLKDAGIEYEIIPGITAAMGAAATAGIPLTARGYATAVRLLTCYHPDLIADVMWQDLAATDDTLVFYMSAETLPSVVGKLRQHNISSAKMLAIVEQATTPLQKVFTYNLYDDKAKQHRIMVSPTLVIIGKVVALHEEFRWLQNSRETRAYFTPVPVSDYQNKMEPA